jgi:hypothetical protein
MIEFKSCKQVESRLVIELKKGDKEVIAVLGPQTVGMQFVSNTTGASELLKVVVAAINEVEKPVEQPDQALVVVADPASHSPVIEKVVAEVVTKRSSKAPGKP